MRGIKKMKVRREFVDRKHSCADIESLKGIVGVGSEQCSLIFKRAPDVSEELIC
jgi:hypothetical protein